MLENPGDDEGIGEDCWDGVLAFVVNKLNVEDGEKQVGSVVLIEVESTFVGDLVEVGMGIDGVKSCDDLVELEMAIDGAKSCGVMGGLRTEGGSHWDRGEGDGSGDPTLNNERNGVGMEGKEIGDIKLRSCLT